MEDGLRWLRFVLGSEQSMPEIKSWSDVYDFAVKHISLVYVVPSRTMFACHKISCSNGLEMWNS